MLIEALNKIVIECFKAKSAIGLEGEKLIKKSSLF